MATSALKSVWLFAFIGLLSACKPATTEVSRPLTVFEGKTMGTFYSVKISGELPVQSAQLQHDIDAVLEQANNDISTYRSESVLSRFNRYSGSEPQPIPSGMADIILAAQRIGRATGGAMDITVGPLVNLWGFGPQKQPVTIPTQAQIDEARRKVGLEHLRLISTHQGEWLQKDLPDLYVDLSTLGEGYGADVLAQLMTRNGISHYLVSVGGAISSRGVNGQGQPWRVAIQKPTDKENAIQAAVDLQGYGISTSGSYRNYFEQDGKRYSHVIDPATGRPITHQLVSATVIARTALEADGWDTGLMVLGPEKALELAKQQGLAVYLITKTDKGFETMMTPQFKTFLLPSP
ncbi:FAD:protein FMN transferase ApbE [Dickeya lacustris]|uniref:FAD:protein FMN transferase n=1 Tax=Dickeya lacustris TaxID=2259638 RepID=A0ABY8GBG8_9GAMM|nr:FAD:protein FMN transferase ApbE [Dickeya lacustris]WFN57262.1 FAD:protein FMN transferase ApbE [Dickeya lacustris]